MEASGGGFSAGALVGGKYRLQRRLGEGAMGVVWSAVNGATGGLVALKLIVRSDPELKLRLQREARACGGIRHLNVVQVHDIGAVENGDPFLVMELLHGETLAALLARKRRLPSHEAAAIARDVARALDAAHRAGIVHRDLKPANIFLHTEPGASAPTVKVVDFGVSKNLLACDGLRTIDGGAVGSPMYMSPEQARADRDVDPRADLWSLGVVLYEMLTGERPFAGEAMEVIMKITSDPIPRASKRLRRIDPDLDRIVAGCLTRDRDARLGPAAEIARQLDRHASPEERAAGAPVGVEDPTLPLEPAMISPRPSAPGIAGAEPTWNAPGGGTVPLQAAVLPFLGARRIFAAGPTGGAGPMDGTGPLGETKPLSGAGPMLGAPPPPPPPRPSSPDSQSPLAPGDATTPSRAGDSLLAAVADNRSALASAGAGPDTAPSGPLGSPPPTRRSPSWAVVAVSVAVVVSILVTVAVWLSAASRGPSPAGHPPEGPSPEGPSPERQSPEGPSPGGPAQEKPSLERPSPGAPAPAPSPAGDLQGAGPSGAPTAAADALRAPRPATVPASAPAASHAPTAPSMAAPRPAATTSKKAGTFRPAPAPANTRCTSKFRVGCK